MLGGKGSAPIWASVLLAAEAWGTPPWSIVKTRSSAKWLARWSELQRLRQFVSNRTAIAGDDDGEG